MMCPILKHPYLPRKCPTVFFGYKPTSTQQYFLDNNTPLNIEITAVKRLQSVKGS